MRYTITGDNLQFANIEIGPGEMVYAEAGSMAYMTGNIQMQARARGGIMKGLGRALMGESFFVTEFQAQGGPGIVGFAGDAPGKIMALDLRGGRVFFLQKSSFLVAEGAVNLDIAFQRRLGAALFGGEGLIIQKAWGEGTIFISACGDLIEKQLAPGELMRVSTAHVVGWEASVQYDIAPVGGIKTALFGGEGLFLTTLRGPGKVIIQSMTLQKLANSLIPYLPKPDNSRGIRIG
ncbi:MAG: TIGR00266 family protein [Methanomassiliicoccales archaeon]